MKESIKAKRLSNATFARKHLPNLAASKAMREFIQEKNHNACRKSRKQNLMALKFDYFSTVIGPKNFNIKIYLIKKYLTLAD